MTKLKAAQYPKQVVRAVSIRVASSREVFEVFIFICRTATNVRTVINGPYSSEGTEDKIINQ